MLKYGLVLVWTVGLAGLAACGGGGGKSPNAKTVIVPLDWKPASVRIACPSGDCPDAAGVLIFGRADAQTKYKLARCTATLISEDTILTNAHCDDEIPDYTNAFFILPSAAGTPIVANVVQKTYEEMGPVKGFDRDMAIFKLDRAMPGTPRKIARQVPARISRLIAYSVDQRPGDFDFTDLVLAKKECRVEKRVPLIGGGVDDKTLGLTLYDCDVQHGNSGSAMYLPGDTMNIQALMNSLWTFSSQESKTADKVRGLFYLLPEFLRKDFGMAERLHCADVPGQLPPQEFCRRVDLDQSGGQKLRAAAVVGMDQWLNSIPAGTAGLEWTLQAVDGEVTLADGAKAAVAFIPRPHCFVSEPAAVTLSLPVLRVGLHPNGDSESRLAFQKAMDFRFARAGAAVVMSVALRDVDPQPMEFTASARSRAGLEAATASPQQVQIPACGPNARAEARQKALQSVNTYLRLVEAEFN